MKEHPRSSFYTFFYILFLPDTWQILMGFLLAIFLAPLLLSPGMGLAAKGMIYIMIAAIGYAVTVIPARRIVRMLKKMILGDKHP
ncbi:MAG: hypothetical protein ACOC3W_05275 [Thermodesulfobacteriota bacterium]